MSRKLMSMMLFNMKRILLKQTKHINIYNQNLFFTKTHTHTHKLQRQRSKKTIPLILVFYLSFVVAMSAIKNLITTWCSNLASSSIM